MTDAFAQQRRALNQCRFTHHDNGHYESYFLRANHPSRPLAFWIRYTIFAPRGDAGGNIGELWVIAFDGENDRIQAAKAEYPLAQCQFDNAGLNVRIGSATLEPGKLQGSVQQGSNHIQWQLSYQPGAEPLLLLPAALYDKPLPKAKALVANHNAVFSGQLIVNGEILPVDH